MLSFIFLKPKVIKVFIIIFDQFNESLMRKSINLFFKNCVEPKLGIECYSMSKNSKISMKLTFYILSMER